MIAALVASMALTGEPIDPWLGEWVAVDGANKRLHFWSAKGGRLRVWGHHYRFGVGVQGTPAGVLSIEAVGELKDGTLELEDPCRVRAHRERHFIVVSESIGCGGSGTSLIGRYRRSRE